ncbi:MAG: N(1)-aminopropylagmatine ureohydrolase [Desulfovibrio sp.]
MIRFLASEYPALPPEECVFQVVPVPHEATVSYGCGTGAGPMAIIEASSQLEVWTGEAAPGEHGIHTWPLVETHGQEGETVTAVIEEATKQAVLRGRGGKGLPVLLGGEHSITFGALRALQKIYGEFGVIQFDAHADLRDTYEGSKYSHACVMRRAHADLGLPLFQIGVRSLSPEEVAYRKEHRDISYLDARELARKGGLVWLRDSPHPILPDEFPQRVFVTFDVDAFDSGIMPATGTPEPGGLSWWEALILVRRCLAGRECIGFDVNELAPIESMVAPTFAAARLTYELMAETARANAL